MTSSEARDKFKLLLDRAGSAYFSDDEIYSFLNLAQLEVLNRMIPDSLGGVINYEFDQNTYENISSLVNYMSMSPQLSGSNGFIAYSNLRTQLITNSGDTSCDVFRIYAINYGNTNLPIKYLSPSRVGTYLNNTFKSDTPYFTMHHRSFGQIISIYNCPVSVNLTIIKTPKILTASNTPDFGDYVMNQVILKALELAGVSTHDPEYVGTLRNSGIQSAE